MFNSENIRKTAGQRQQRDELSRQFILDCLQANALGDGTLFQVLGEGLVRYNVSSQEWLVWTGHHWTTDRFDCCKTLVEQVALTYLQQKIDIEKEARSTEKKDHAKSLESIANELRKRVYRLRSVSGQNNCLELAKTAPGGPNLCVAQEQLDQDPMLIAGPNGAFDLGLGELRPGRKKDLATKSVGPDLPEDCLNVECPSWLQFLWDCLEDQAVIDFLRRWCGYILTSYTDEQVFLILSGSGRNGKGVFIETVLSAMGDYAGPVQAELLLDQGRARASSAPSPDIMSLQGKRLIVASESDEARRFSPSRIKWLTGSDTLVGRNPHDKHETKFSPTHKLVLLTNNEPGAPADDFAFWNRLLKVDWPFSFVSKPKHNHEKLRDERLQQKLQGELTGILGWMIQGCIEWQLNGLQVPPKILNAVADYQRSEDIIQDYLDERAVDMRDAAQPERHKVSAADLYQDFSEWFQKYHSRKVPSLQWFGRRMAKKFPKEKIGTYHYLGLALATKE